MLSTWKIAPALAAGCTVVHKPAEWSPITATLLAEICAARGPAGRRAEHRARPRRDRGQGAHRASRDPRRRVRRRVGHGQRDHGAGRADAEAPALRARRQESRRRVRGRGPRPRARRGRVHDLQPERRALHVVEPAARRAARSRTSSPRALVERARKIKVGHPLDPDDRGRAARSIPRTSQKVLELLRRRARRSAWRSRSAARARPLGGNYVQPTLLAAAQQFACASRKRRSSARCSR